MAPDGCLTGEWGFKGFVLSDLGAAKMSYENHHTAASPADALAQTLKAWVSDMQFYDWPHAEFMQAIDTALAQGLLTTATARPRSGRTCFE